jgi:hypothetical protein
MEEGCEMKRGLQILALAAFCLTATCGCSMWDMPAPVLPPISPPVSGQIRLSEGLYAQKAPVAYWRPYFTGEAREWKFDPKEPWSLNIGGDSASNQEPGFTAHVSLSAHLAESVDYAGRYINSNGYLTILLVNPTPERAAQIAGLSAAPVWIVAAGYPYSLLEKAKDETWQALTSWLGDHPDVPVSNMGIGVDESENIVSIRMHGSGVPLLERAFDLPGYIKLSYTPSIDASLPHDIPHEPDTVWEKDRAVIKSARQSYPIGATFLLVTAGHDVGHMRLFAPYVPLGVEKYANGGWHDISAVASFLIYFCKHTV